MPTIPKKMRKGEWRDESTYQNRAKVCNFVGALDVIVYYKFGKKVSYQITNYVRADPRV